jgi:ABC-2 type transport system ATP-binding protein
MSRPAGAPAVEARHIAKTYSSKKAVDDLSFTVNPGEILGLIGPNGAGKTSTIRMVMDIIKPDSGEVLLFGEERTTSTKRRLGYLPEERGLNRKLTVIDSIVYLASLLGMEKGTTLRRADELLARTGMIAWRARKIETLSKGMAQLIQFIVAVIHEPELVILDEPFTGLDPVNVELLKTMLGELKEQGKAIILSTHGMGDVEELSDRVLMVNGGRAILYGELQEIRSRYRVGSVLVDVAGKIEDFGPIAGVIDTRSRRHHAELVLDGKATPQGVLETLVHRGAVIRHFEAAAPSLNDIFLQAVEARS